MVSIGEITGTVRSILRESKDASKAKINIKIVKPEELPSTTQKYDKVKPFARKVVESEGLTDASERRIMEAYYA